MSSSCQLGALWEANSPPVTVTVNWISKAEAGPVTGMVPRQLYCDSSLSCFSLPFSESTWLWMPTQCNGQLEQPIFMCLNPTSYSQLTSEQTLTQRLPRDLHLPVLKSQTLLHPPAQCAHAYATTLQAFFFSFRAFETTQNTVTLVPKIQLSSQKLTPVCLGGERDVRAAPQMGSGWQGPPGTGAELCYLFSLHCRSGWCWGVVLG